MQLFLTDETRHLNSPSKKNFYALLLGHFLSVLEELFHAVIVAGLQEIFKAFLKAELLVSIGKKTDIY